MSERAGPVRAEAARPAALVRRPAITVRPAPVAATTPPRSVRRNPLAHAEVPVVVQAKLLLGAMHDPLEHEADRVAARAVASRAASTAAPVAEATGTAPSSAAAESEVAVRRASASHASAGIAIADPTLTARIRAPPAGISVPDQVRSRVEPLVGFDLSGVHVHDSTPDREVAAGLGARAFTVGSDIWLGPDESRHDIALMAHELTHVAQGARGPPVVRRMLGGYPTSLDEVITWARGKVREKVAALPFYDLITLVAGKDLVTGTAVEPSAPAFLRAFMKAAGEAERYAELEKSGKVQAAFDWVNAELNSRQLTVAAVVSALTRVWQKAQSIDVTDLITSPSATLHQVQDAVEGALALMKELGGRLLSFAGAVAKKLAELAVNALIEAAGPMGARILALLKKAGHTVDQLIADPVRFGGILLRAAAEGFKLFGANFLKHLERALVSWLFGSLNIKPPAKWNLKSMLGLAFEVLGLTWKHVRQRMVKRVGEPTVAAIETGVDFVVTLVRDGIGAAWEKVVGWIGNLQDMVVGAVKSWVMDTVVGKAVMKLVAMFSPIGGAIELLQGVYAAVSQFIEKAEKYLELAERIVAGFARIVGGDTSGAAAAIEDGLARVLGLALDFLARYLGFDNVGKYIRQAIEKARSAIEGAIDKLIGYVVDLFGKLKSKATAWWKRTVRFKVGGASHKVSFVGEGEAAAVKIESDPQTVAEFVKLQTPLVGSLAPAARSSASQALTAMTADNKLIVDQKKMAANKQNVEAIRKATTDIANNAEKVLLATSGDDLKGSFQTGPTLAGGVGTLARVVIVRNNKLAKGTKVSASSQLWKAVRRYPSSGGRSTHYVQGHLVNRLLNGPGDNPGNLTPITRAANAAHLNQVEQKVKSLAAKVKPGGLTSLTYEVKAVYGGASHALADAKPVPTHLMPGQEAKVSETAHSISQTAVIFKCSWTAVGSTNTADNTPGKVETDVPLMLGTPTAYPTDKTHVFRDDLAEDMPAD